jgi:hypothetical protein
MRHTRQTLAAEQVRQKFFFPERDSVAKRCHSVTFLDFNVTDLPFTQTCVSRLSFCLVRPSFAVSFKLSRATQTSKLPSTTRKRLCGAAFGHSHAHRTRSAHRHARRPLFRMSWRTLTYSHPCAIGGGGQAFRNCRPNTTNIRLPTFRVARCAIRARKRLSTSFVRRLQSRDVCSSRIRKEDCFSPMRACQRVAERIFFFRAMLIGRRFFFCV